MNSLMMVLAVALRYAGIGWPIVPLHAVTSAGTCSCSDESCDHVGKHSWCSGGIHDASTDPDTIRRWWELRPKSNLGLVCGKVSGRVVLNVDQRTGGEATLAALEQRFGALPVSLEVETGDGRHVVFLHPGIRIPANLDLGPGLTILGDGAHVVGPGSRHANGRVYTVKAGRENTPEAALPWWIVSRVTCRDSVSNGDGGTDLPAVIETGRRNSILMRLAGSMRHKGWDEARILTELSAVNCSRCSPPLPVDEVERLANSVMQYAPGTIEDVDATADEILRRLGIHEFNGDTPPSKLEALIHDLAGALKKQSAAKQDWIKTLAEERLANSGVKHAKGLVRSAGKEAKEMGDGLPGREVRVEEMKPWPHSVDLGAWLREVTVFVRRFVSMPALGAEAVALWLAHTWMIAATHFSPRLVFNSPTMRCGKTAALEVVFALSRCGIWASNISAAALYSLLDAHAPTLVVDEYDSFGRLHPELRNVLNSGYEPKGSVIKSRGEDHQPREFHTFGALALAMIGAVHPTVRDRSVHIVLHRKRETETVERLNRDAVQILALPLKQQAARIAVDYTSRLAAMSPTIPAVLSDRAADIWKILLAIADLAGGDWPHLAREAAVKLGATSNSEEGAEMLLLRQVVEVVEGYGDPRISAQQLTDSLVATGDDEFKGLTKQKLARVLSAFGVSTKDLRFSSDTDGTSQVRKGYLISDFSEPVERYLGRRLRLLANADNCFPLPPEAWCKPESRESCEGDQERSDDDDGIGGGTTGIGPDPTDMGPFEGVLA